MIITGTMMSLSEPRILGTDRQDVDHQLDDDDVRYWRRRDAAQGGVEPRREEELRVDLDLLQRGHALGRGDSTPRSPLASQRPRRHRARGVLVSSTFSLTLFCFASRMKQARRPSFMMASRCLLHVPCTQLVGRSSSPSSSRWSSDDDDVRYRRRRCPLPATRSDVQGDVELEFADYP